MQELAAPPQGVLQQAPPGEEGTEAGGVGEAPSSGLRLLQTDIPFFSSEKLTKFECSVTSSPFVMNMNNQTHDQSKVLNCIADYF